LGTTSLITNGNLHINKKMENDDNYLD